MIGGDFGVYILTITGAVVIIAVSEILMPEGKTAKYVKSALSVFLVFIIISPIANFFNKGIDYKDIFKQDVLQSDYTFTAKLNEQRAKAMEKSAQKYLEQKGYENILVKVLYSGSKEGIEVDFIHLDLTYFEFNGDSQHIYIIDNIIDLTAEYFNVSKERVYTYGENQ